MIDALVQASQAEYEQGMERLRAGKAEPALLALHRGLEALLRWCLVRDGAEVARATDPAQVTWQDLIAYLDARYAVPREVCLFLSEMTYRYGQAAAGMHPDLPQEPMQRYADVVRRLFIRLYPRDQTERDEVAMQATYGRPRAVDVVTALPPERAHDTRVVVPMEPAESDGWRAPAASPPPAPAPAPSAGDVAPIPAFPTFGAAAAATPPDAPARSAARPPGAAARPAAAAPDAFGFAAAAPPAAGGPPPAGGWGSGAAAGDLTVSVAAMRGAAGAAPAPDPQERVLAAGRQLRAMRQNGQEFCPSCRAVVAATAPVCPRCQFDLAAYRARTGVAAAPSAPSARPASSPLERLFGRSR